MSESSVLPFGSWPSPLDAATITAGGTPASSPRWDNDDLYWMESRPAEAGRVVIVRRAPDGTVADVTPAPFSARTRVHEYGGGAWLVAAGVVVFSNYADQRLYRHRPGESPVPITPEPSIPAGDRFADGRMTPDGEWVVCVREHHGAGGDVANEVVAVATSGDREPISLASGHDFYACPRLSPDGRRLCWLAWDHPQMPWDGTELFVGDFAIEPEPVVADVRRLAGGTTESVFQPEWSPSGVLHFVSDRTGWWNLYRADDDTTSLIPRAAEFGVPLWSLGTSTYAFVSDGRMVVRWTEGGSDHLGVFDGGDLRELSLGYSTFSGPVIGPGGVAVVAGGPTQEAAIVTFPLDVPASPTVVKRPRALTIAEGIVSPARPIEFPTTGDRTAYAYFYPPRNPSTIGPADARPPLVVISHGGPTSAASPTLNLTIQFWTARGFAVVDVDYGGSSGHGRAYRDRLKGEWGIVDVDDCIQAARWLVEQGEVDGDRLVIRGGSAGGYTTLSALTFHDVFAAGASYYGVADAARLATDTHKFEARYLDGLIGPYPEDAETYRQRSPIHFVDRLSCPLIIFQGLEDQVVPPSQAEMMVEALAARGIPHAYLAFEGEQHGFRRAETQQRCLEAELYFYSRILGFELADPVEPVDIAMA